MQIVRHFGARHHILVLLVLALSSVPRAFAQEISPARNLGATFASLAGDRLLYAVFESFRGEDLNGDGDTADRVLHVEDLSSGEITNLGLAAGSRTDPAGSHALISGDWLVFCVSEDGQGEDLNGDGDTGDEVLHSHDRATGETANLGLVAGTTFLGATSFWAWISDTWFLCWIPEMLQGEDLNGDGDTEDEVFRIRDLSKGVTTAIRLGGTYEGLISGDRLVLDADEQVQREDLNGDGDATDARVVHVHNLSTGITTNLRLARNQAWISGDWVVLEVDEWSQGRDLNGDGDTDDRPFHAHDLLTGVTTNRGFTGNSMIPVVAGEWLVFDENEVFHAHNLSTGETRNLGLSSGFGPYRSSAVISEEWLILNVSEFLQGEDLDGDGDRDYSVFHAHNLSTGVTTNLRLTADRFAASRHWLVLWVLEGQGEDLNGDGDTEDAVVVVHNLATGVTTNLGLQPVCIRFGLAACGGGPRWFLSEDWLAFLAVPSGVHVHELSTGVTTNLGLAGAGPDMIVSGDRLVVAISESERGQDLNGDGDTADSVDHLVDLSALRSPVPRFARGDPNSSGTTDISDAITIFGFLFLGSPAALSCRESADANNDGTLDISDGIYLLSWLFTGGPEPAAPGPTDRPCGVDPDPAGSAGDLGCVEYPVCP